MCGSTSCRPCSRPRPGGLPDEHIQLGLLTDGSLQDIRGAVEAVVRRFSPLAQIQTVAAEIAGFAPGAAAQVLVGGGERNLPFAPAGVMGVVSDAVRDYYGLAASPAGAMVRLDAILAPWGGPRRYQPVPRFPAIQRDLSVIVDETLTWRELVEVARQAAGELCTQIDYVTTYRGKQVGQGRKSITLRLTYRHAERTLRHEEVDQSVAGVVAALGERFDATLRT